MAHNLGAMHARAQFSEELIDVYAKRGILPYAYGIRFPGQFRTIMSYSCSPTCPRINYFSDPTKASNGVAIGDFSRMDNARAIHGERAYIASVISDYLSMNEDSRKLPQIVKQPQGGHVPEDDGYTLEVVAINFRPSPHETLLEYQWYRDGTLLSGATGNQLKVKHVPGVGIETTYFVEVSNSTGHVRSDSVTVDFRKKPQIVRQPQGGAASTEGLLLEVEAINPNPPPYEEELSYQWYQNGQLLPNGTEPTLFVEPSYEISFETTYFVEVSHSVAKVQSDVIIVEFLTRPRSGKWDILVNHENPASDVEIGQIDRDLGLTDEVSLEE